MLPDCERCDSRMHLDDETTKLLEYRCPVCHAKRIESRTGSSQLRADAVQN